jgi:hypothetical protein
MVKNFRDNIKTPELFFYMGSKRHAHQWIIYPENMGTHLSIAEVTLSQGELYTILTNKKFKGRKGSLVVIVAGIKTDQVIEHISKKCFPKAIQVTDRFHVQKLAPEALQEIRIKHQLEAMQWFLRINRY